MKRPKYLIILVLLLVTFGYLSVRSALAESLTYDEIVYIQEGYNAWLHQTFAIDTNNPPFARDIETLPLVLGAQRFVQPNNPNLQVLPARMVTIIFGLLLITSVYWVTLQYFTELMALLAAGLVTFEPNILANSHYITLDTAVTLFVFLSYVCFLQCLKKKSRWRRWLVLGVTIGFAFATKLTAIPFLLGSILLAILIEKRRDTLRWVWKQKKNIIGTLLLAAFVIWATYFFRMDVVVAQRADAHRVSVRLYQFATTHHYDLIVSMLRFTETVKIPLGTYIAAIKNTVIRNEVSGQYFLLGKMYDRHEWYMMILNVLVKTPLPLILLFLGGCLYTVKKKQKTTELLFVAPVIVMLLMSSLGSLQPFVRYVLPIYPFVAIIATYVLQIRAPKAFRLGILGILIGWLIVGTLSSQPHFISYANEMAGPSKLLYQKFTDSNIDWGQSLPDFGMYVRKQNPIHVSFSYFGRDNGDAYGLPSNFPYGSHKFNDICAFHEISRPIGTTASMSAISIGNWYYCNYYLNSRYVKGKVKYIVGGSILVF